MRKQLIKYLVTEIIIKGRSTIPVYHNQTLELMSGIEVVGMIFGNKDLFLKKALTSRY